MASATLALFALLAFVIALNPYILLVFSSEPLKPPTPPILTGLNTTLGTVHHSGCPPWEDFDLRNPGGIESRVEQAFPAGTQQENVTKSLIAQGFKVEPPCSTDRSVRYATFIQSGGGFYGPYPAYAVITWKVDAQGHVVWTSGSVAYTGP